MFGSFKRAVCKHFINIKDFDWNEHHEEVLSGYYRVPDDDRKSLFEILFRIINRFAIEPPGLDLIPLNQELAELFKIYLAMSHSTVCTREVKG